MQTQSSLKLNIHNKPRFRQAKNGFLCLFSAVGLAIQKRIMERFFAIQH
jgi:hypothetical protein